MTHQQIESSHPK